MAETLWLPKVTYQKGDKKFIFIYKGKPMPKQKAADIFEKVFTKPNTKLLIGFVRSRV